jgi:transposase-like protein
MSPSAAFIASMPRRFPDITPDLKRQYLELIASGRLSQAEVAAYLDCDRKTVSRWCSAAGIDPRASRWAYVARTLRTLTRKKPPRKADLRRIARHAVDAWRAAHKDRST